MRASRGYTHDPWPCCGKDSGSKRGRPKQGICWDCKQLIADGQLWRNQQNAKPGLGLFTWTSTNYGWPRFYGARCEWPNHGHPESQRHVLENAFFALANLLVDTPGGDMLTAWGSPRSGERAPFLLSDRGHDSWSWSRTVMARKDVQAALDGLHQAIRDALGLVYLEGKERGSRLLVQLANGEKTLADFEDRVVKP